jgi:hypothetical protein
VWSFYDKPMLDVKHMWFVRTISPYIFGQNHD